MDDIRNCAARAGVTRLAEITKLDGLDVPTFQAVRPWSRALCTHQGKGLDRGQAQRSALMEAVESDAAERFDGERVRASAAELTDGGRLAVDDFARKRGAVHPDVELEWTPLTRWRDGGRAWAPWLYVSLDLTHSHDAPVERTSNGLAAHLDIDRARSAALCELLERDAMTAWLAQPLASRAGDRLALATTDAPWLTALVDRGRRRGVAFSLFGFRALGGWPVIVCVIEEAAALNARRVRIWGSACRPTSDAALEAAVTEAAQSRLGMISAVRDDVLPDRSGPRPTSFGFAPPLPPGFRERDFHSFRQGDFYGPADAFAMAETLERLGYGPVLD